MATLTLPSSAVQTSLQSGVPRLYTPEEYLALEETADARHEYRDGEIWEMPGATEEHGQIVANITAEFVYQLKRRPCRIIPADMRVRVTTAGLYTYPDVVVVCGDSIKEGINLLNPTLIVEVLSDSTEAYDRGDKFRRYQTVNSLTDYIMVSQHIPRIEHYARQQAGRWLLSSAEGLENSLSIESISVTLALADVYDKIHWTAETMLDELTTQVESNTR